MVAVKENRVYTITDAEMESFRKEGYDILDDKGKVIAYGVGKTVPFEKYVELQEQVESLKKEVASLKEKKG
ncbi:MAG: hypothetical protein IIY21_02890 [Clostridiales bacterium]|nr:hypothetical protein [Clostridiales bacterium]